MTIEAADIGVGWSVHEKAPDLSDYEPRGGIVVEVVSTREVDDHGEPLRRLKTMRFHQGKLKVVELDEREIELSTATRPSEVQPFVISALVKALCGMVNKDRSKKFSDYQRWLVKVAYDLSVRL